MDRRNFVTWLAASFPFAYFRRHRDGYFVVELDSKDFKQFAKCAADNGWVVTFKEDC